MIKRKETLYRCEHCKKPYFSSSGCRTHENKCFHDAKNQSCITCVNSNFGCTNNKEDMIRAERVKVSDQLYFNCSRWQAIPEE